MYKPDAKSKTHFIITDCIGVCESELNDTYPLERKRTISFEKLLQSVAFGNTDAEALSSLASRLGRLARQLSTEERAKLKEIAGGQSLKEITTAIVSALDPDRHVEEARRAGGLPPNAEPTPEQVAQAAVQLR